MNNKDSHKYIIYSYKGRLYEHPPFKRFYIDETILGKDNVTTLVVRKRFSNVFHIIIILLMISTTLTPYFYIKYNNNLNISTNERIHKIRVPKELYYDKETKTLDLDITNDSSNLEKLNIKLETKDEKVIVEFKGIQPGHTIGTIPIEYNFNKLPETCIIEYKTLSDLNKINTNKIEVLIVDREVANKDINRDF